MSFEGYTLYQVIGALAALLITGGMGKMVLNWLFSGEKRDGKVSDGWKRYAEKLEKQLEVRDAAHEAENARKDAQIIEQEETIRKLNHALRNAETTVNIVNDVRSLEKQATKEELHEAVDSSIDKMTP